MHLKRLLHVSVLLAMVAVPATAQPARSAMAAVHAVPALAAAGDRSDDLYDRARDLIEQGKFDRAIGDLERVIELKGGRTDAALYWKAYSLGKLGRRADAEDGREQSDPHSDGD